MMNDSKINVDIINLCNYLKKVVDAADLSFKLPAIVHALT